MKKLILTLMLGGLVFGFYTSDIFASEGHGHGHNHDHGDKHQHQDKHDANSKTVEVIGEIMDIECYFVHPDDGQGEEHAACAKQCINKGIPTAIRSGGKLYILIGGGHKAPKDKVAKFAGHRVVLKGILRHKEGLSVIQIKEVKKAKAHQKDSLKEIKEKKKDDKKKGHNEGSEGSEGSGHNH